MNYLGKELTCQRYKHNNINFMLRMQMGMAMKIIMFMTITDEINELV